MAWASSEGKNSRENETHAEETSKYPCIHAIVGQARSGYEAGHEQCGRYHGNDSPCGRDHILVVLLDTLCELKHAYCCHERKTGETGEHIMVVFSVGKRKKEDRYQGPKPCEAIRGIGFSPHSFQGWDSADQGYEGPRKETRWKLSQVVPPGTAITDSSLGATYRMSKPEIDGRRLLNDHQSRPSPGNKNSQHQSNGGPHSLPGMSFTLPQEPCQARYQGHGCTEHEALTQVCQANKDPEGYG